MIRSVIIDDVNNSRLTLADDLRTHCPEVVILGEANSVKSAIDLIKRVKPDIVFLDIELEDGTGFDILEYFDKITFKTIFITGFDSYGIKAIKFSALDYLLKPVDPDDLIKAIKKYKDNEVQPDVKANIDFLLENIRGIKPGFKRIALNSADKVNMVNIDDIIRCESQSNYTLFYIKGGEQILVTKSLKEYENLLEEYSFVRVHHSHLINLNYLKEYVKTDGGYAVMTDKSTVPVSVRKRDNLLRELGI
ncbi:MAG TPA: LytTR family DNA-binding domain-containing protein [Bacteroidales bacterium]